MEDKKKTVLLRALICGLTLAAIFYVTSFASTANSVRSDCVRLHILANSDSDKDQSLKLKVRDVLLKSGEELFSGSVSPDDVKQELEKSKEKLISAAEKVILDEGFEYGVDIYFIEEYFTTRSYGEYTLPAGRYKAVKVVIGEGKGHNWWCVMFPPLCLPGFCETEKEVYLTENGSELIEENPKLEPRFKIVEWFEKLYEKIG
ncbi:MAG: Stage II sporulation protein R (spore_II_R) [Firmicutes bacterium ADurb.Bin300]|nr:MAG: Stage II sporulation protein R (spore_II_R) [Firmicutes bacterium ADurb.Bin300]